MINIIGIKRILILLVLVVLNTCLAATIYLYAMPEREDSEREVRALRSQSITVQTDIENMQMEFEQLGKQQSKFDALKASGFFDLQDRSNAKDLMKSIQEESKVVSAVVNIKSGYVEKNEDAEKANHVVLISPITIEIKAFDDADVYRYLDIMQRKFSGVVTIERLEIKRVQDVNAPVLRSIAAGASPELIDAKLYLFWTTVVPKTALGQQEIEGLEGVQQ